MLKSRILAVLFVLFLVLTVASAAYAISYSLNQTVAVTIKVNQAPADGPQSAVIYNEPAFISPLTTLNFTYPQGGSAEYIGFVHHSQITSLNPITLTGFPAGVTLNATLGPTTGDITEVHFIASGGSVMASPVTANVTITGGG